MKNKDSGLKKRILSEAKEFIGLFAAIDSARDVNG